MGAFPWRSFQDAHEFILQLLGVSNCESFQFSCLSVVQCNTCQSLSWEQSFYFFSFYFSFFQSIWELLPGAVLQVAIDPFTSRNICAYLESYFEPETIEYGCTACQREYPAVRQIQLVATPNLIMVQLKRFKWNNGRLQKLNSLIECPMTITFFSKEFDLIAPIMWAV